MSRKTKVREYIISITLLVNPLTNLPQILIGKLGRTLGMKLVSRQNWVSKLVYHVYENEYFKNLTLK